MTFTEVQERLGNARGPAYWRSLEELAQTAEFQELVEREYSGPSGGWTDAVSRRTFLALAAASLGLALSGCAQAPPERIVPYVRTPEGMVPGRRQYFATAMPMPDDALGLLIASHDGRPTKVEGNPDHPGSPKPAESAEAGRFGPTDVFAQASVLTLYDPERSPAAKNFGNISTWDAFVAALRHALGQRGDRTRVALLTESIASPSLANQLSLLSTRWPEARWYVHEPTARDNVHAGARLAFGDRVEPRYRIERADVIVAVDADFLNEGPGHLRHLHDFAARRRVRRGRTEGMNRLYVVESIPSGTGAMADHRLPLRSRDSAALAVALAGRLDARLRRFAREAPGVPARWLDAVAADLSRHRGASLVIAGPRQPPFVHALVYGINDALGNVGRTLYYARPVATEASHGGLRELTEAMTDGAIDVLLSLGGNPAYTAPANVPFAQSIERVPFRVHLGLYDDETSALCHWQLPHAHFLEAWGDVRSHDGTVSIIQPLIAPLHGGKTVAEVVSLLAYDSLRSSHDLVRGYWGNLFDDGASHANQVRADWRAQGLLAAFGGGFEDWWWRTLHDGFAAGTQLPAQNVTFRPDAIEAPAPHQAADELEINFRADPTIHDGRFANNGWLQELPKPVSKLTWDNAVYVSPATAVRLGLAPADHAERSNEKVVVLTYRERTLEAPLWVLPGHADDAITIHLGYGRRRAGGVGVGAGFDAYRLRTDAAPWFDAGVSLRLTDRRHPLACTQNHHLIENRDLIRSGTVREPPPMPRRLSLTLFNDAEHSRAANQWGMVIDLNVCTGCSACVVACQAENNIPVVGKEEVRRGREMHWLRVDRYFAGDAAHPSLQFQPVPCMHCENAPCEIVCPVAATVHSSDGLNDMIYNRCVGTRYCSNNCPYKVRRFNFLHYANIAAPILHSLQNPEVSVRSRGVMEKCTYCVQRIRAGQIAARLEDRAVADGEVVTACQAACPAGAIVFGDLSDTRSQVARLRFEPLHYALLEELNTRPRTTYLAVAKNPNPDI